MIVAVKPVKAKRPARTQYSTRGRIARLQERLEQEPDSRVRRVIEAQLAAFSRPPQGAYD